MNLIESPMNLVEEEESSKTNGDKWLCALYMTILFLIVSMPATYKFTNTLLKGVCVLASKNGCPTIFGILVHTLVFLLLLRLSAELVPIREGNNAVRRREKRRKARQKVRQNSRKNTGRKMRRGSKRNLSVSNNPLYNSKK